MKPKATTLKIVVFLLILSQSLPTAAFASGSSIYFEQHVIADYMPWGVPTFVTDMDYDGDIDILANDRLDGVLYLYTNDGNQNFSPHIIDHIDAAYIDAGDIDHDGDMDLAVTGFAIYHYEIHWYENQGDMTFVRHRLVNYGVDTVFTDIVDFDHDGDLDIISTAHGWSLAHIDWFENDGNKIFTQHEILNQTVPHNYGCSIPAPTDIDQDGDLDLVLACDSTPVFLLENDGAQNFTRRDISRPLTASYNTGAVDMDNDGDIDVLGSDWQDGTFWWENDGFQNFTEHRISSNRSEITFVSAADVDHDGDMDVIEPVSGLHQVSLWTNDGSMNFTEKITIPMIHGTRMTAVVDLDRDEDDDIVMIDDSIPGNLSWYEQKKASDYPLTEEFNSSDGFTQTTSGVYIDNGLVNWSISRSPAGFQQYVYRSIPAFSGDVKLTVRGQVNGYNNNCSVEAGIGDGIYTFEPPFTYKGTAITYGFFGGGCPIQGPLIRARGVALDHEHYCYSTVGNWLWINRNVPYTAELTIQDGIVNLNVPGVGSVSGTSTYTGEYNTLFVGLTGDGDWPSCSGTIDYVKVEPLNQLPVNQPPTVDLGGPYTVDEGSSVILTAVGSDPDGDPLTYDWDLDNDGSYETPGQSVTFSAAAFDGPSSYSVAVQVTDNGGLTATSEAIVTVLNIAPSPKSGLDQTVYRNEPVTITGTWTDPAGVLDDPFVWSWDLNGDGVPDNNGTASYGNTISETAAFTQEGLYTLTFKVADKDGGEGLDSLDIEVLNMPPTCSNATPSVELLWPPDHSFVPVEILGLSDPEGDSLSVAILNIFQDEPVDSTGDGSFVPDGQGVGTSIAEVRAERDGGGNGRVYHISFSADDGHGGSCTGVTHVGVPKSQGKKGAPVDDGPLYDSTAIP